MTRIFADACYWIALINRKDQLYTAAVAQQEGLGGVCLVTTDEVLNEVLTKYCKSGRKMRQIITSSVDEIRTDSRVEIFAQTRESFDEAFALYKARPDKQYSLTDCRSFVLMRHLNLNEALTDDHHFVQEGFKALLDSSGT